MWAIVTGGSSGLGFAIARRLRREGYNLVICSREQDSILAAKSSLERMVECSNVILTYAGDLSCPGAVERLHQWTRERGVDPQILVNDAGMYIYRNIREISSEEMSSIIGLNVSAVASMCRLFGSDMAKAPGRRYILNIASYSIYMPIENLSLYAATKAFNKTFSTCIAKDLRRSDVLVTAVSPAGIDTDLMGLRPGIRRLARATRFLASPDTIARISLRVMRIPFIRHWIPLCYNALFIPFLWLFQPLFKKVL